jgi:hypothetical protein
LAVQKKSRAHFSVETPYLVAVVKGTKFKVAVTATYAEVAVQEGRVQVRALKTGKYADIVAGQKALVDKAGNLKLSGKGKFASIMTGSPRAAAVSQTAGASGNLSAGGVGAQAGIGLGSGGLSVNGGASIGGASVGVGASVGSGASVGASVGGGGIGLGGGLSLGGKSISGSLGLGRR